MGSKRNLDEMKVELKEAELLTLRILSNLRSLVARGKGITDAKMSDSSGGDIDFDGLLGEYAFCKAYNLFLDIAPIPRSGSYDCIRKSERIDIKTTRHQNGRLLATMKKNEDVDIYVLCIITGATLEFRGWAWADELIQEENIIDLGYGRGYGLTQDKLKPLKALKTVGVV